MTRNLLGLLMIVAAGLPGLAEAHGRGGFGGGFHGGGGSFHASVGFGGGYRPAVVVRPTFVAPRYYAPRYVAPPVVLAPRLVRPRVYVEPCGSVSTYVSPTYVPAAPTPSPVLQVGTVLPNLPQSSQTYVVNGVTYAYSTTNYFMWDGAQGGWVVVPPPQ